MLKKRIVGLISVLMVAILSLSSVACNGEEKYDPLNEDQIKVVISSLGFGMEQYYKIAEAFEVTHPGKKVVVEKTVVSDALISQLEVDSFIGDVCMFNDNRLWSVWRKGNMEVLDDVINSIPDGEEKTVGEKCDSFLIDAYKVGDGHYYSIPWMNENSGLVYNKTALDTLLGVGKWTLPKTTNELYALCERIQATKNGYGFVWNDAYIAFEVFEAQYNGLEQCIKNSQGYYYDKQSNTYKMSDEEVQCIKDNVGYLRRLEQVEKIVTKYSHQYSRNMSFIDAQSAWAGVPYAGDNKYSVFMPNGDWAYHETKEDLDYTGHKVGFMKTPVISDIVETLDMYEDGDTAFSKLTAQKQATYDAKLRAVIDYVDGEIEDAPSGVSQNDIERIAEARSLISGKSQAEAFIPFNSNKKELAKEFLVFMASDMATSIYSQETEGFSPFINKEKYTDIHFDSDFMTEASQVLSKSQKVVIPYGDMYLSGFSKPRVTSFAQAFAGDYTAQSFFDAELIRFKTEWSLILKNAGLTQ